MRVTRWPVEPEVSAAPTVPARSRSRLASMLVTACITLSVIGCGAGATGQPSTTPSASAASLATPAPTGTENPASASATATVATPTPVPSGRITVTGADQTFASLRYGYSLTVGAADWLVRETPGTWNGAFEPHHFNPDPGTDWFRDPGVATIELGVLAVSSGTTLATWEASEAPAVRGGACQDVPPAQALTVGGERLLLLPEACSKVVQGEFAGNQFFMNAFLVHGTDGVVVQWDSEQGHEAADKVAFLKILATLKWTAG
jgi:hypothetical protein